MGGLCLLFIIVACTSSAQETPTEAPTPDPDSVKTFVAQTVEAELTHVAASQPTETITSPTDTQIVNTPVPSATSTPQPSATVLAEFENHVEFITDVTVPDGTVFPPDANFTKTWRLKNIGSKTWTTEYSFVFVNGDRMEGNAISLGQDVLPGQTIDISIPMTAPAEPDTYTGFWMFADENDNLFGVGEEANLAVFVEIQVTLATATPGGPTATLDSTSRVTNTPEPSGLTGVNITVDSADYTGECPHTFTFDINFTLNGPATFRFQLEADAEDPNYTFDLPDPETVSSTQSGAHTETRTYELTLRTSVSGQAFVHILEPDDELSDPVSFNLTCQ